MLTKKFFFVTALIKNKPFLEPERLGDKNKIRRVLVDNNRKVYKGLK